VSFREKFLLYVLASIFASQILLFGWAAVQCGAHGGLKVCPALGQRYDTTFAVMISTVLALLTGSKLGKQ
jgi:hypothetical protein